MRADAAAGRCVAHHQVVQARIRHEAEPFQQRPSFRQEMVHILHQQRPTSRPQIAEETWFERTMMHFPFPRLSHNYARLRIVAAGQAHEVPWSEQTLEAFDSAPDQQWSSLPIACEKAAWRESSQQGGDARSIRHAWIIAVHASAALEVAAAHPRSNSASANFHASQNRLESIGRFDGQKYLC
jgi:hypothetical protein